MFCQKWHVAHSNPEIQMVLKEGKTPNSKNGLKDVDGPPSTVFLWKIVRRDIFLLDKYLKQSPESVYLVSCNIKNL